MNEIEHITKKAHCTPPEKTRTAPRSKTQWAAFLISVLILLYGAYGAGAQEKIRLSYDNAGWTSVMSGRAISAPEKTSYGFVVLTDGKLLEAYSEGGKSLWDLPIGTRKPLYISVLSSDFIVLVSDGSTVSLVNPSGRLLWSRDMGFTVTEKPCVGRDSRILVQGKNTIACLGVNGIEKWRLSTPDLKKSPIQSLDDGTFVAHLESKKEARSEGFRFSPYGEALETITFASSLSSSLSTKYGMLVSFLSGGIGLVSVEGKQDGSGKTETKWAIPSDDGAFRESITSSGINLVPLTEETSAALIKNISGNVKALFFENRTGKIIDIFHITEIKFDGISCVSGTYGQEGLFISDSDTALALDVHGKKLYTALLPQKNARGTGWNHVFYTGENHIVIAGNSWTLNAFRTLSRIGKKTEAKKKTCGNYSYDNFLKVREGENLFAYSRAVPRDAVSRNRMEELSGGGYGQREMQFSREIFALCEAYIQEKNTSASVARFSYGEKFSDDAAALETVFSSMSLFGTDDFPRALARLIKAEDSDVLLKSLVLASGRTGYDPESLMLDALNSRLAVIPARNSAVLVPLSNAVFEICAFMGRPAFFSYGMEIQKKLLYPQYPGEVREAARNNLSKIARLKM